jgi:hypothetical protein
MDTYSYKGWLNSDNFWKRAFGIMGYSYAAMLGVWLAIMSFALVLGIFGGIWGLMFPY